MVTTVESYLHNVELLRDQTGAHVEVATQGIQEFVQDPNSIFILCQIISSNANTIFKMHAIISIINYIKENNEFDEEYLEQFKNLLISLFTPENIELNQLLVEAARNLVEKINGEWLELINLAFVSDSDKEYKYELINSIIADYYPDYLKSNLPIIFDLVRDGIESGKEETILGCIKVSYNLFIKVPGSHQQFQELTTKIREILNSSIEENQFSILDKLVALDEKILWIFIEDQSFQLILEKLLNQELTFDIKYKFNALLSTLLPLKIDNLSPELLDQILNFEVFFAMDSFSQEYSYNLIMMDFVNITKLILSTIPMKFLQEMVETKFNELIENNTREIVCIGLLLMATGIKTYPTIFSNYAPQVFKTVVESLVSDDQYIASTCAFILIYVKLFEDYIKINFETVWANTEQYISQSSDVSLTTNILQILSECASDNPETVIQLVNWCFSEMERAPDPNTYTPMLMNLVTNLRDLEALQNIYNQIYELISNNKDNYSLFILILGQIMRYLSAFDFFQENLEGLVKMIETFIKSSDLYLNSLAIEVTGNILDNIKDIEIIKILYNDIKPFADMLDRNCSQYEHNVYCSAYSFCVSFLRYCVYEFRNENINFDSPENIGFFVNKGMLGLEVGHEEEIISVLNIILSKLINCNNSKDEGLTNVLASLLEKLISMDFDDGVCICLSDIHGLHPELFDENCSNVILTKSDKCFEEILGKQQLTPDLVNIHSNTIYNISRILKTVSDEDKKSELCLKYYNLYANYVNDDQLNAYYKLLWIYLILTLDCVVFSFLDQENFLFIESFLLSNLLESDNAASIIVANIADSCLKAYNFQKSSMITKEKWITTISEKLNNTDETNKIEITMREKLLSLLISFSLLYGQNYDKELLKNALTNVLPIRYEFNVLPTISSSLNVLQMTGVDMTEIFRKLIIQFAVPRYQREKMDCEEVLIYTFATPMKNFLASLGEEAENFIRETLNNNELSIFYLNLFFQESDKAWAQMMAGFNDVNTGEVYDLSGEET